MGKKVAVGVTMLLGIAVLLFAVRACSAEDSVDDSPDGASPSASASSSTPPPPVKMATTLISTAIKTRLDEVSGRPTRVECPDRVEQKIGTTFTCDVFYEDEPGTAPAAKADVEIDGPDGHFSWTSTPTGQG